MAQDVFFLIFLSFQIQEDEASELDDHDATRLVKNMIGFKSSFSKTLWSFVPRFVFTSWSRVKKGLSQGQLYYSGLK